MSAIARIYW